MPGLPPLPPVNASDEAVAAWVRAAIAVVDDTPRHPQWRYRAIGSSQADAVADTTFARRDARLDLRFAPIEARIIAQVARDREMRTRTYMRRAIGTILVVCDGVDPALIPSLTPMVPPR